MFPHTKPPAGTQINPLHPLSNGLVGCWLFNEGAGSLVNDISGNKNHGRLTNMAPNVHGSGWGSDGLEFDGVDDCVDCGSRGSLTISNNISIEAWAKRAGINGWEGIVTKKAGSVGDYRNYELGFAGSGLGALEDSIGFFFYTGTGWAGYSSDVAYTDTNWHHYAVTHVFGDGTNTKLYRDGVEISCAWNDGTGNETPVTGNYSLFIGSVDSEQQFFNGSIDSVCIYNRALSADEIAWSYREPYAMFEPAFNPALLYSAAPLVGAIMNQFQKANIGADLYNGVFA